MQFDTPDPDESRPTLDASARGVAETDSFLYAWQLREFVPGAVRPTTDPTAARRAAIQAAEA